MEVFKNEPDFNLECFQKAINVAVEKVDRNLKKFIRDSEILKEKSYDAHYAENLEEAKKQILDMIPIGSSIALGGSETLNEMGLVDIFRSNDFWTQKSNCSCWS
jgi:hypothetical protein